MGLYDLTWFDEIPLVRGTAVSKGDHRLAGTELSFSKLLDLVSSAFLL